MAERAMTAAGRVEDVAVAEGAEAVVAGGVDLVLARGVRPRGADLRH